jgi:hypothetical protein
MRFSISNPVSLWTMTSSTAEESAKINANPASAAQLQLEALLEQSVCAWSAYPEAPSVLGALHCDEARPSDNPRATFLQWQLWPSAFCARNQERFLFESSSTCLQHTFMLKTCQAQNGVSLALRSHILISPAQSLHLTL